jgi:flagellar M-ring protein FliF
MNEKLQDYNKRIKEFWGRRTKGQKLTMIGGLVTIILVVTITSILSMKVNLVPLYSNLSPQETGQIKATLDQRGITSVISDNGATISVPEQVVDTLKVELAAEGIPESGNIDYSFFGKNAGFGMTDNEFNIIKLEATQTEISNLIKEIEGVNDAKVMISLPEKSIWVNEEGQQASASIVLKTNPGYKFQPDQIKALYHLVSKSVPNLPTDNIVIMNQNFEYFDLENEKNNSNGTNFADQLAIKKQIERDLQRQVQQMLGTMMGQDKVVVSVTADIDFKQENREENLIEPVDKENMEGLAVSVERITETFTGEKAVGGIPGTQDGDISGNDTVTSNNGNGDYEKIEERINNEVNKIRKQIVESPYKVRDLGVQVMVEPPNPNKANSMSEKTVNDIKNILGTVVRTSIAKNEDGTTLTQDEIANKIYVSVQPFKGKVEFDSNKGLLTLPTWAYVLIVVIILIIIGLIIYFVRRSKAKQYSINELEAASMSEIIPDITEEQNSDFNARKKQLEKLAKDKPEDFAKLLRTWLSVE